MQAGHFQPFTQKMFGHAWLGLEDGQRNSSDGGDMSVFTADQYQNSTEEATHAVASPLCDR